MTGGPWQHGPHQGHPHLAVTASRSLPATAVSPPDAPSLLPILKLLCNISWILFS